MADMIKFFKGALASLPTTGVNGAIYITEDEGGIYLGTGSGMKRLGDFIQVDAVANLPTDGANTSALYYCVSENVLAKWDGAKWTQINKQRTAEEVKTLIGLADYETKTDAAQKLVDAKAYTDTEVAKVQGEVDALETYVGTIPTTEAYKDIDNVVAYVDKKAAETLAAAQGGSSETAASVKQQLDTYIAANDTKVNANTDAITAIKDGTEIDSFSDVEAAINGVEADVESIAGSIGTVEEGKTVIGLIGDAQAAADKAQGEVDALEKVVGTPTEGKTIVEMIAAAQEAATYDDTELAGKVAAIEGDYLKAADKTELQGNIDKKVDQTAYDAKIGELAGADTTLQGNIDAEATARSEADTALSGRITTLEGQITGLSGAMHFKGVKEEIPADVTGYVDGDVIVVGEKEYVFNGGAFVEFGDVSAEGERIAALEGVVGKAAEGENAATGLVKGVADNAAAIAQEKSDREAAVAELAGVDATNLQAAKDYADDAVEALGIGDYVKKADADAAYAAIGHDHDDKYDAKGDAAQALTDAKAYADTAEEDAVNTAKAYTDELANGQVKTNTEAIATKAAQTDLDNAVTRIGTAEGKITDLETASATHALKTEVEAVQTALDEYIESNDAAVDLKANAADVYAKTETYNKDEVDALLTWGSF